jgi:hypothetical protein
MISINEYIGYFFVAVIFSFAFLIYFLLKYREKLLNENLQLSPNDVWETLFDRATKYGFAKSDQLYGVFHDKVKNSSIIVLSIKDDTGKVIGQIDFPIGFREFRLVFDSGETYLIEYPPTWRKTIKLKNSLGELLATIERPAFSLTKHTIVIANFGTFQSSRPHFDFRTSFVYKMNDKVMGFSQNISRTRQMGQVAFFKSELSKPVKAFILIACVRGI